MHSAGAETELLNPPPPPGAGPRLAIITGNAGVMEPGRFTQVFPFFIREDVSWHMPGAPFLLASGLVMMGGVIRGGRRV